MNVSQQQLNKIANQTRRDIVRMVHAVQSGHPGGSLGCTEILVYLFNNYLKYRIPNHQNGEGEDVFILSNGHISPVFYSVLARVGFFELDELNTFRKLNSRLQGHPAVKEKLPGVRVATGSLGQGLSVGIGIAEGKKLNNDNRQTVVLMGDGELQEGQCWEAIMYAGHNKLHKLLAIVDFNGQQIDGATKEIMGFNELKSKFASFAWETYEMDGNSFEEIHRTFEEQKSSDGNKPRVIIMKTEMGNGVDFMMGSHKWHGIAPNDEQLEQALQQNPETLGDY
ncbi:MAG: Transketolase 2 [Bacteroidetes bacterium MED-G17]|nr:MAG: Transketolase 2 [Bacteroidetes bacterium MED-G17]